LCGKELKEFRNLELFLILNILVAMYLSVFRNKIGSMALMESFLSFGVLNNMTSGCERNCNFFLNGKLNGIM
jgi:hypothetical protein